MVKVAEYRCPRCELIYSWEDVDRNHGVCENCGVWPIMASRDATPEEEAEMSAIRQLRALRERYWRPVIARKAGLLVHMGDCKVHRAVSKELGQYTAPCTCGFNHDLRWLSGNLVEKLNPNYGEEYRKQECGIFEEERTQLQLEDAKMILKEFFGPFHEVTPEERAEDDTREWKWIAHVFGEDYVEFMKRGFNPSSFDTQFGNKLFDNSAEEK